MTTKSFPIPATCTKCGHRGDIFVDDARLHQALEEYRKTRIWALVAPLLVRRIMALAAVSFALGILLGRCAR